MPEVNAELKKLAKQMKPKELATLIDQALEPVLNDAKRLAPIETGTLRRSIRKATKTTGNKVEGRVGTNLIYAPFQEFGTIHQSGTAYLRPSWDLNKSRVMSRLIDGIKANMRGK